MILGSGCGRAAQGVKQEESVLRFKMKSLAGEDVDLAEYSGKVVLAVNVASKCGYTRQYEQLQQLHEKYSEKGLAVLGFPCNQFLGQEPGSASEIREFCRVNYGVTFDMFAKVDVNGDKACEFYRLLTFLDTKPKGAGKIGWNFEKFIIDRKGFVVARFGAGTKPDAPEVVALIESALAQEPEANDASASKARPQGIDFTLPDYRWKKRVLLLFASSRDEKAYQDFRRGWDAHGEEVSDRDLLLVEAVEKGDSRVGNELLSETSSEKLRKEFRVDLGATVFLLIGKDGTQKLRRGAYSSTNCSN
jgi:glutathione peroxidase